MRVDGWWGLGIPGHRPGPRSLNRLVSREGSPLSRPSSGVSCGRELEVSRIRHTGHSVIPGWRVTTESDRGLCPSVSFGRGSEGVEPGLPRHHPHPIPDPTRLDFPDRMDERPHKPPQPRHRHQPHDESRAPAPQGPRVLTQTSTVQDMVDHEEPPTPTDPDVDLPSVTPQSRYHRRVQSRRTTHQLPVHLRP